MISLPHSDSFPLFRGTLRYQGSESLSGLLGRISFERELVLLSQFVSVPKPIRENLVGQES